MPDIGELNEALEHALRENNLGAAHEALEQRAKLRGNEKNWRALIGRVVEGEVGIVAVCADYLDRDSLNRALITAAKEGQDAMVDLLISKDADPHFIDDLALRKAAAGNHVSTVRLLLARGGNIAAGNYQSFNEAIFSVENEERRDETLAVLSRAAEENGCLIEVIRAHHHGHLEKIASLLRSSPSERRASLLGAKGEATPLLRILTAAGKLPELFAFQPFKHPPEWRELYSAICKALPEYRAETEAVDMALFRPEALESGMVSRIQERKTSLPGVHR